MLPLNDIFMVSNKKAPFPLSLTQALNRTQLNTSD